jgi:hypothetical protein
MMPRQVAGTVFGSITKRLRLNYPSPLRNRPLPANTTPNSLGLNHHNIVRQPAKCSQRGSPKVPESPLHCVRTSLHPVGYIRLASGSQKNAEDSQDCPSAVSAPERAGANVAPRVARRITIHPAIATRWFRKNFIFKRGHLAQRPQERRCGCGGIGSLRSSRS